MAPQIDITVPVSQDMAGREFDKWFDWNGATTLTDTSMADVKHVRPSDSHAVLPISPLSVTHSDFNSSTIHPQSLTAPPHDLPTPRHSSGSPEARSSIDLRLSGETLRESTSSATRPLKRKLSPSDTPIIEPQRDEHTPAAKKRPHNIIEKRYRANLNEKIAELRDSVPSLRSAKKTKGKDGSDETDDDDLDGLTPSNKLNKASVLTKAVEYIRHLEFRTKRLEDENKSLKERLVELDKVIAQGGHDSQRTTAFTSENVIEEQPSARHSDESESSTPQDTPPSRPAQGLIPIPESWRRLRQNQSQEHYAHIYETPSNRSPFRGKWPTRIMIGSLAGLMLMDGLSESDHGTDSRAKGLFGIPLELLDGWTFLKSPRLYLATFSQFCRAGGVIPLVKGFCALTILAFLIFAYLFNSKPAPKEDIEGDAACSEQTPVPASPIEVRRRAWSTSMQALKLPHHSFFPEWLAVTAEWLKYTVRYLFGYSAYFWLTGRSVEDDAARIKAWDIAIDAQLAGGDTEVSRSRVVLTSFGSGTLPQTPLRLMQKSLHCRVLLWNVGKTGSASYRLANGTAKFLANREWRRARALHEKAPLRDPDRLPSNLGSLLSMDCDEILTDIVVQRAYNLMYDRPTGEQSEDSMLDVVVEDHAVRSPLDAVAAWRSISSLRKALEMAPQSPGEIDILQEHLAVALRIAPPGSAAETRALAAHALFGASNRSSCLLRATEMLQPQKSHRGHDLDLPGPFFIDSSTPPSARAELENCLHCAKVLLAFEQHRDAAKARAEFYDVPIKFSGDSLMTAAARKHTATLLPGLNDQSVEVGYAPESMHQVADRPWREPGLRQQKRRQSNVSHDTGYESQDDDSDYSMHDDMYERGRSEQMASMS